ncbi:OsmC family peroxiredoxin [Demequina pelophila]|uniref:OsmC family peroxiredoxin n=1 Tax=Demequina pelophila TaxID=1638984 RepID=UPI0007861644|nr:OsmC family peroxiredoxin [Demequina pelophila]
MAVTSRADAQWSDGLASGSGSVALASGAGEFSMTWKARSEGVDGATTPEELLAAAHSSCFSMALTHELEGNGTPPAWVKTSAQVSFVPGTGVTASVLTVAAKVPGIADEDFQRIAAAAKDGCPVSQALAGVEITLSGATLMD